MTNEQMEKVKVQLKKMKVGFCKVMWDCLVWRVSPSRWRVGGRTISLRNDTDNLDDAAHMIKLLNTGN